MIDGNYDEVKYIIIDGKPANYLIIDHRCLPADEVIIDEVIPIDGKPANYRWYKVTDHFYVSFPLFLVGK